MNNDNLFRIGVSSDVPSIMGLIRQRISWMDDKGINQWNKSRYTELYPDSYYAEAAAKGLLRVLCDSYDRVIASAVLLHSDKRWNNTVNANALYVHNLVAAINAKGAGRAMIASIEKLALSQGKTAVRLDCAVANERLNQWYESMGYVYAGTTVDGEYHGILREKRI